MEIKRHLSEDVLDGYVMRTLTGTATLRSESHLLICEACRHRLEEMEQFLIAVRAAPRTRVTSARSYRFSHETDDGLIVSEVTRFGTKGWTARHWGPQLNGGRTTKTLKEATAYLVESFHQMFPEHVCTERCWNDEIPRDQV